MRRDPKGFSPLGISMGVLDILSNIKKNLVNGQCDDLRE